MLSKEPEGAHIASKLLATHIQSPTEREALQALTVRHVQIYILIMSRNVYLLNFGQQIPGN